MERAKIRLVIIVSQFSAGGAEKVIATLLNNLENTQYDLHLISLVKVSPFFELQKHVKIHFLNTGYFTGLFKIRNKLLELHPDIVLTSVSYFNIYVAFFKFLLPKGISYVARESNLLSILNKDEGLIKGYFWGTIIGKLVYKRGFDYYIAQSKVMKQDLIVNFGISTNKIHIISNPAYMLSLNHNSSRKNPALLDEKRRFVTVGRLHPQKGYERVLNALSNIEYDFEYHIFGDGPQLAQLKKMIYSLGLQNKVFLRGVSKNVHDEIRKADVFLLGSFYEGFPNVVLECSLLGVPVVSFQCANCLDGIIEDGCNGYVTLDDSLESFLNNINLASSLINQNEVMKAYVIEKFGLEKFIHAYDSLFRSIHRIQELK